MSMKIVANRGIGMVKQSPFQHDLFDFKYIEEQVSAIKKNQKRKKVTDLSNEKDLTEILDNQLSVLNKIQQILSEIENNTKKKKHWFNFKD